MKGYESGKFKPGDTLPTGETFIGETEDGSPLWNEPVRPDDQEKIDAWWRARSEVKVDGNSRAEYVLQRDAAWERAEAAEAEIQRLREERDEAQGLLARILDYGAAGYAEHQARRSAWASRDASPSDGGGA